MLQKAQLIVQKTAKNPGTTIDVMYNPTELTDSKSVQTCGEGSNIQFQRVIRDDFTVQLFFDTYEKGTDVRKETQKIEALLKPTEGEDRKEPPVVLFSWAQVWFTGIIVNLQQSFTMFLETGVPVRARLTVTFKSVLSQEEELKSLGFYACRQLYTVREGDRLDLIANKTMGSSGFWPLIAQTNNIEDPLTFPTPDQRGMQLIIPDTHNLS